jgi:hypothetical protein
VVQARRWDSNRTIAEENAVGADVKGRLAASVGFAACGESAERNTLGLSEPSHNGQLHVLVNGPRVLVVGPYTLLETCRAHQSVHALYTQLPLHMRNMTVFTAGPHMAVRLLLCCWVRMPIQFGVWADSNAASDGKAGTL